MSKRHPGSRHHAALNWRAWARARRAAFQRDEYRCTSCSVAGKLEAHHVVELRDGGPAYDLANIKTLCRSCHMAEHCRQPTPAEAAWRDLVTEVETLTPS